jgi:hypothetical protein
LIIGDVQSDSLLQGKIIRGFDLLEMSLACGPRGELHFTRRYLGKATTAR